MKKCGGGLRNSVYRIERDIVSSTHVSQHKGKNLLALVMMVKDEAHTLPSTLIGLRSIIDYYFIIDTGSHDGTPEKIKSTLRDVPGEVIFVRAIVEQLIFVLPVVFKNSFPAVFFHRNLLWIMARHAIECWTLPSIHPTLRRLY